MPLVLLTVSPAFLASRNRELAVFTKAIPAIVADALTCADAGGVLEARDIEVRVLQTGKYDVNGLEMAMDILASDYASRKKNLDHRNAEIQAGCSRKLHDLGLDGMTAGIWVMLMPASYRTFKVGAES